MSKSKIDRILNRAANTVGRVLGNKCVVYRPLNYLTPISDENLLVSKNAAFLLDEKFTKTVDYKFQVFNVEVDTSDVLAGDIFVDGADTYVILSARPAEGCKAYLASTLITVNRPTYTSSTPGSFGPTATAIAVGLPVNMYSIKGTSAANPNEGRQTPGKHVSYEMRIYTTEPILLVGDQLIDANGAKSIISSVEYGPLGYVVIAESV